MIASYPQNISQSSIKNPQTISNLGIIFGGSGEIRTHGGLSPTLVLA